MPQYQVVYEDTAPFFTYSGAWRAGASADDKAAEQYSDSSFMVTMTQGASFSFKFYGTEVSITGVKRFGHGQYQVPLDGIRDPVETGDALQDQFNMILYTTTVAKGRHNVTLTNGQDHYLDVDTVAWTTSVGKDDEPLIVNTWQDSHPSFRYSPADAWTTSSRNVGSFSAGSGHGTSAVGATAQVTFEGQKALSSSTPKWSSQTHFICFETGDVIALYGPVGPNGPASYSVQVDSQVPSTHSGVKQFQRSRQLLYYGGNLGQGTHTLTVRLESVSSPSQVLAVDYVEVYTALSLGGSYGNVSSSKPIGLIVGMAVLGIIALFALSLLAYIFYLYKNRRLRFVHGESDDSNTQTFERRHAVAGFTMFPAGTTNNSRMSGATYQPIRKHRLQHQDVAEETNAAPPPPPAYMDS